MLIRDMSSGNIALNKLAIDTMVVASDMVLWLGVEASERGFDVTYHYPVLAGHNSLGVPLYVAKARGENMYHFTCAEDGAVEVKYLDEMGDECATSDFLVLALRQDPSDMRPPYPPTHHSAMDPTGPLHWLKFWPEKDPDYNAASDTANGDDRLLEMKFHRRYISQTSNREAAAPSDRPPIT